ncbi:MAG: helix-turn-helix transcriptional regulator [Deltaproteobacteria bacterium]|nr:helix-turn-helix transcriptional regulator [Deltaproteobacteria bacterium]
MLAHTNEPLIDLHIRGPAENKEEALLALRALGYTEKTEGVPSWRDAFPSDIRENEGGVCLKVTRERKGLTQAELSAMTGIPQPHISQMERGKRPIGKKTAHQLAKALQEDYRVFL